MPVGEFIAEIGLRFVLEVVFYGIFYWIGFAVIKAASFGSARLAPLSTIEEKNRRKKGRKIDWSIWLHRPMQGKMLKAEAVCFVGMIVCGLIGYIVYLTVT